MPAYARPRLRLWPRLRLSLLTPHANKGRPARNGGPVLAVPHTSPRQRGERMPSVTAVYSETAERRLQTLRSQNERCAPKRTTPATRKEWASQQRPEVPRILRSTALIAGALALSSFTASAPVAAQATRHHRDDNRNYRDGRDYRNDRRDLGRRYTTQVRRDSRPVMRVRYDRYAIATMCARSCAGRSATTATDIAKG
jgi:hypothetical protein